MAVRAMRRGWIHRRRYTRAKAHVRPAVIEVRHPRSQDQFQVALIAGNDEVQAFPA